MRVTSLACLSSVVVVVVVLLLVKDCQVRAFCCCNCCTDVVCFCCLFLLFLVMLLRILRFIWNEYVVLCCVAVFISLSVSSASSSWFIFFSPEQYTKGTKDYHRTIASRECEANFSMTMLKETRFFYDFDLGGKLTFPFAIFNGSKQMNFAVLVLQLHCYSISNSVG